MGIFSSNMGGQQRYSGQLQNLQLTQAVFGTTAPIIFGTQRTAVKLLFYGGFYSVNAPNGGGKGLGGNGKSQQFEYYADVIAALASGSAAGGCRGILNVWDQQGKLQNQSGSFTYTIPTGGGSVAPVTGNAAAIQLDLGVAKSVPYSVIANDYGSGGSRTLTGTQLSPMQKVSGTPGVGQYSFNPTTSTYTFSASDAGARVTISYSTVFSLFYFQATQAAEVPLGAPYQVSTDNQQYFYSDGGVVRVDTGAALVNGSDYSESGGVYTFSASLAGVYVYINYTFTSSDPNITNTSTLNLTFFGGTLGQQPWPYMGSKYPSSAFGYTGLCYVGANPMALGTSGAMPSYNYEVVGLNTFNGGLDAHPCDALKTLLSDAFLGVGFPTANIGDWTDAYAYWAANNYLISKKLDTQTSVSDALSQVIEVGNAAAFFSAGLLKLVPYGDATCVGNGYTYTPKTMPAATLTWDDLLSSSGSASGITQSDPLEVSQKAPQDCWNYVQANWSNRENDYNNDLINEQNDAFVQQYGRRIESPQTWDWITNLPAATWALNLRLKRQCYIRNGYKLTLPFWFSYLEPMDLLVLPTGEDVRITQVECAADGRMSIEAEQWSYGTGDVTIYPKQQATSFQPTASNALPGDAFPVIFETPPLGATSHLNAVQIAVAGNQPSWGGCDIYVSSDGATYVQLGTVKGSGNTGVLCSALVAGTDPDTTDTLSVDMSISGGSLTSATQAQADVFATLAAIVDASGSVELVSYETATLAAADRYNLTYLRRGVYGTPIAAHAIGAEFCFIGIQGLFEYPYPEQYIAKPIYFKFASFNLLGNQVQNLSTCHAYTYTPSGTKYPYPPVVTITQSATAPAGTAAVAAGSVTPSGSGLSASSPIWLTISWSWSSTFPTPTGFQVVAFTGTDPTAAANYLSDIATVAPCMRSYTIAVAPTAAMATVNAAVRAIYA